jgi:hypothetical protein
MNKTICVAFLSVCGAVGYGQTPPPAADAVKPVHAVTPKTVKPKKVIAPRATPQATIPAGAVKTPEGAYRFTDAQGKSWIYRETPFGVSRVPDAPLHAAGTSSVQTPFGATKTSGAPAAATAVTAGKPAGDSTAQVTAVAKGDTIQFQKPTPFGATSWKKNKSDLTPEEQKIWEREQAKGTH